MPDLSDLGRLLLVLGTLFVVLGLVFLFADRVPGVGRLPGDIVIQREGFSCFAPITTMILISILLTILLNVIARFWGR